MDSKGIIKLAPTHRLHWGYHLFWYRRGVFSEEDSGIARLCASYSPHSYKTNPWSTNDTGYLFGDLCFRLFTRRYGVGSSIVPALVIRHFIGHLFHQRLILVTLTGLECPPSTSPPDEVPSAGFGPADSRVEHVSFFNLFVFFYVFVLFRCCLLSCWHLLFYYSL